MRRTAWTGCVVMMALAATLPQRLTAQNDDADAKKPVVKEARGPLPSPFGRLGLSEPQKEKLYSIQSSYDEKITPLEQQIVELKGQRDTSMEALLTPGQKLRLQELREEARLNDEERLKSAADPPAKSSKNSTATP